MGYRRNFYPSDGSLSIGYSSTQQHRGALLWGQHPNWHDSRGVGLRLQTAAGAVHRPRRPEDRGGQLQLHRRDVLLNGPGVHRSIFHHLSLRRGCMHRYARLGRVAGDGYVGAVQRQGRLQREYLGVGYLAGDDHVQDVLWRHSVQSAYRHLEYLQGYEYGARVPIAPPCSIKISAHGIPRR